MEFHGRQWKINLSTGPHQTPVRTLLSRHTARGARLIPWAEEKCQSACKPGSVWRREPPRRPFIWGVHCWTPRATNPDGGAWKPALATRCRAPCHPYLVLLPVGFAVPRPLPSARCALTAPFHPCLDRPKLIQAVCSLWHFPWGRPRRPLAATVLPWSPDFPPPECWPQSLIPPAAAVRPTGIYELGAQGCRRQAPAGNDPFCGGKASISRSRERIVDRSIRPSTSAGRKCRWNAVTTNRVGSSRTPPVATP